MSAALPASLRSDHSSNPFAQLTVLVIDGQKPMRRFLGELLGDMGVQRVITEGSCEAALARLGGPVPIGLALVDAAVESMDGIQFTQQVRQVFTGARRALPIVLMMTLPTAGRICEARDAGVNDIMLKPVSIRSLGAKLTQAVSGARPFIDRPAYVGPDRRRGPRPDYRGPLRRLGDGVRSNIYV
ncbi:Sensor histidine kinase RcsC [Alphaproteobacteria bacterium SO-S41]|nr:Sensor histidine kinase RcsC [Alphaproteobacteria bacterium SO-S41]